MLIFSKIDALDMGGNVSVRNQSWVMAIAQ